MAAFENIHSLMNPKSIAVVGCSENNIGGRVIQNLQRSSEYQGKIYPVNIKRDELFGLKCYKSLLDIPGHVDCCAISLRNTLVLQVVEEMHQKGIKACVIYSSGFSELGVEGQALQEKLVAKLREYNIAACGPNCLGLYNNYSGAFMWGDPVKDGNHGKGNIGIVAHSGAIALVISNSGRGLGFSSVISCGNEAGLTMGDFIRYFVDDEHTKVIVTFLETIRDPDDFADAVHLAHLKGKPVIACRVGRSETGQKTAAAHSGALATSTDIVDAYFAKHGVLQAFSIDEILEMSELMQRIGVKEFVGSKVALLSVSGGLLSLSSDIAEDEGVKFAQISEATKEKLRDALPSFGTPNNPQDVPTGLFDLESYKSCIKAMDADPEVGMILICAETEAFLIEGQDYIYWDVVCAVSEIAGDLEKPIVVYCPLSGGLHPSLKNILHKANVPLLQGIQESMHAVDSYFKWASYQKTPNLGQEEVDSERRDFDFGEGTSLSESRSKELLKTYEIATPKEYLVDTEEDAISAANQIGFPLVMKVDSPDIPHKTEAKVVALGIADEEDVRSTFQKLVDNAALYDPEAVINGISMQEFVEGGVEMLVGVKNDPLYGPVVLLGMGGIFVELFKDYAMRLAPINLNQAYEMISELKGAQLLHGFRGSSEADIESLADLLVRVSHLAIYHKEKIGELDINPLKVLPKGNGVKAVDALVVLKD